MGWLRYGFVLFLIEMHITGDYVQMPAFGGHGPLPSRAVGKVVKVVNINHEIEISRGLLRHQEFAITKYVVREK